MPNVLQDLSTELVPPLKRKGNVAKVITATMMILILSNATLSVCSNTLVLGPQET
jgi:hypothetical protein